MAELSVSEMRKVISGIIRGADLSTLSSKKIRTQLEEKYNTDFTNRKKEIDDVVMELARAEQEKKDTNNGNSFDSEASSSDADSSDDLDAPRPKRAKAPKERTSRNVSWEKREKIGKQDSDEADEDEELARKLHDEEIRSRSRAVKKLSRKGSKKEAKPQGAKASGAKRESTYSRKCALSPELSIVVGADQMARHDVVKKMWEIFRERNLVDPANKQFAFCDEQLIKIFGQKRVRMFGMMKYLKNHIKDIK